MRIAVVLLLLLSVVLALVAGLGGNPPRVYLGWISVACLSAALAIPAVDAL